jgi:hypothetical protein
MTFDEAKERLRFHCGSHPDIEDPRWEQGFLQSHRPYRGLDETTYHDRAACIDAVSDHIQHSGTLDRDVINSLWGICHFARAWALAEDAMLGRNDLITPADQEELDGWISSISHRIAMWLDGNTP